jgi:hypothetical protein
MELLTQEIRDALPAYGSTEDVPLADKIVVVKFFNPCGSWTWYAVEGEPCEDGDFEFWGLVDGFEMEWGPWVLSELQSVRGPLGLGIERDLYFTPKPLREVLGSRIDAGDTRAAVALNL